MPPANTIDIRRFPVYGDGVTDDTPGILQAIAFRRLQGYGDIYFPRPPVAYVMQPQTYVYGPNFVASTCAADIDFSDLTIFGDPGVSRIILRTFGGGNPDTDFHLIWRNALDSWYPFGSPSTPASWAAHAVYAPGAVILGPNGHFYITFAGGTSGPGPGPTAIVPALASNVSDGGITDWALWDYTWRGGFFRIRSSAVDPVVGPGNIVFQDLIFDGRAPYRADILGPLATRTAPSPTATAYDRAGLGVGGSTLPGGQGWATGHSPVVLAPPYNYGPVTFRRCQFLNWRSENIFASYGSRLSGKITVDECTFDNATGDALSCTAPLLVKDTVFTNSSQAIECDPGGFEATFDGVRISDCSFGLVLPSSAAFYIGRGRTLINDCIVERCGAAGVVISGYAANVKVAKSVITDCNQFGGGASLWIFDQFGGSPRNIEIDSVSIVSDTLVVLRGLMVTARASASTGNTIHGCRFSRTSTAVSVGATIGHSMQVSAAAASDWDVHDNDCRGATFAPQGFGDASSPNDPLPVRFTRNRTDGMTFEALVLPFLDPRGFDDFSVLPGGAANFTTARGFTAGVQTRIVVNANVTLTASATIVLAPGSSWAPGGTGGETAFIRPSASSNKVYEIPGRRITY